MLKVVAEVRPDPDALIMVVEEEEVCLRACAKVWRQAMGLRASKGQGFPARKQTVALRGTP